MTEPAQPLDLDQIEARARELMRVSGLNYDQGAEHLAQTDVPAMAAELRRLRAELAATHHDERAKGIAEAANVVDAKPTAEPASADGSAVAGHTDDEAEAREPHHSWRVEILDGDTWVSDSRSFGARSVAVDRYQAARHNAPTWADGQPVPRRLVRETTSYTVETEPAAGGAQQPDHAGDEA